MGRIFELKTNHFGLKHLFGQPTLNFKQTRWVKFLTKYDYKIKHIKGKEDQVVDTLSRRAHEMHIATIIMYTYELKDKIIEATNSDHHYLKLKETLQQGNLQQRFKYCELWEDKILMYRDKVYVSNCSEMKNTLMREIHNVPSIRHPGYQKSIAVVWSQYFRPRMKK